MTGNDQLRAQWDKSLRPVIRKIDAEAGAHHRADGDRNE
jgi:hypothetical protein